MAPFQQDNEYVEEPFVSSFSFSKCEATTRTNNSKKKQARRKSILHQSSLKRKMPPHWPLTSPRPPTEGNEHSIRRRVHFPQEEKGYVTSIRSRPYTSITEQHILYYSVLDFDRFKREYLQMLAERQASSANRNEKSQAQAQTQAQSLKQDAESTEETPHDNSFWRSKVGRRWHSGKNNNPTESATIETNKLTAESHPTQARAAKAVLNNAASSSVDGAASPSQLSTPPGEKIFNEEESDNEFLDELSIDDTEADQDEPPLPMPSSTNFSTVFSQEEESVGGGSIFSSVFDVACEAVSILNGPSSSNMSCTQQQQKFQGHNPSMQHLVDTLYLY